MATITGHTTRAVGTILTAAIYNADHVNHVTNALALNTDKLEGATPPVVDGHAAVFDGVTGAILKSLGSAPAIPSRLIATGTGLLGGGDLSANRTLTADLATVAHYRAASPVNKILVADVAWAAAGLVTLTDAATIAVDMALLINAVVTLAGNRTLAAPTNTKAGQAGVILIKQDATGSRTLAYDAVWKFPGGTLPVLSTGANMVDKLFYFVETSSIIHAELVKNTTR